MSDSACCVFRGNSSAQDFALAAKSVKYRHGGRFIVTFCKAVDVLRIYRYNAVSEQKPLEVFSGISACTDAEFELLKNDSRKRVSAFS